MIKRILVALDPSPDTIIATEYAIDIAQKNDAAVTGLAVIDAGKIAAEAVGSGIGVMYYSDLLKKHLDKETRDISKRLIGEFDERIAATGIEHMFSMKEGVPFDRIIEDMKVHDLICIGRRPNFFYSNPEPESKTLTKIVRNATIPVFIAGNEYRPIRRVMIAYDGSPAVIRAIHSLTHLQPFGIPEYCVLVHVRQSEDEKVKKDSDLLLSLAAGYLEDHGMSNVDVSNLSKGDIADKLILTADQLEIDLLVAGTHSGSMWRRLAFGSTLEKLLEEDIRPFWVYH
ncbi:MAG TPA: universal stress protein [Balneolales bacterium]|nr:universal stress protein [Balneolales bacterium]